MSFREQAIAEKQARLAKRLAKRQAAQRRYGVITGTQIGSPYNDPANTQRWNYVEYPHCSDWIPATYSHYALQCKLGEWCMPGHIDRYVRQGILVQTADGKYTGQSVHVLLMLIEERQASELDYEAHRANEPRHNQFGGLGYSSAHKY